MARMYHINCISTCPLGGRLMDGRSASVLERGELSCHCILVELADTLVLIDTGMGRKDVANPRSRLSWFFLSLLDPALRDEMTAFRQVQALGFDPRDVRHIVLTHLDFDHAGGLDDFPWATVHMMRAEKEYAFQQATWLDRQRFRPQQWSTQGAWKTYDAIAGDTWNGFAAVRELVGLPTDILMVPLRGHTFGHAGIAVQRDGGTWLMQAGDAYFYRDEMHPHHPYCTPGLRFYQWMMEKDRPARLACQAKLRHLATQQPADVQVCCAHDVVEFEALAGRPARLPATVVRPGASVPHAPVGRV